jgi:acyl-coenzyme A thioesterase PaaI-like protein
MTQTSSSLYTSEERNLAADALRRLGHSFVSHELNNSDFQRITEFVDEFLTDIKERPERSRQILEMKRDRFAVVPPDGGSVEHFPDCIVSGPANPMGIFAQAHREKDEAVLRVTLGNAFEGAPKRAHGGIVAALFDDTMGFVLSILQTPAYTGQLCVSYLAPTPIGSEIEFRAKCEKIEGRKIFISGLAHFEGKTIATADAIFISVPRERFAAGV